jgi:ferredoxin
MTHVITALCMRHGGCVTVCPVNCIVPGRPLDEWPYFYIDPAVCTDCGKCIPACPYNAIWPEQAVPGFLQDGVQANYDFFDRGPGYDAREDDKMYPDSERR